MASEKVVYWMAVGVLALAATNGLVSELYRGWAGHFEDRSIAMVEQASEIAERCADLGERGRENGDIGRVMRAQVRLAHLRSTMARHQAETVRVQVEGIRARVMEQGIQSVIACPRENLVVDVDVPEPPQISEDGTF